MQMEHEKCLEIVLHSSAQIIPTLIYITSFKGVLAATLVNLENDSKDDVDICGIVEEAGIAHRVSTG